MVAIIWLQWSEEKRERESLAISDRVRRIHVMCDCCICCKMLLLPFLVDSCTPRVMCVFFSFSFPLVLYVVCSISCNICVSCGIVSVCVFASLRIWSTGCVCIWCGQLWLYLNRLVPFPQAQTKFVFSRLRFRRLIRHKNVIIHKYRYKNRILWKQRQNAKENQLTTKR